MNSEGNKRRKDLNQALNEKVVPSLGEHDRDAIKRKTTEVTLDGISLSQQAKSKYIGLDCEMVGIGAQGKQSALARCCMVDFDGNTLYDKFVRPKAFVTDFRTQWSGVRKQDLRAGEAITFSECQQDVANILKSKILVGHALTNDMDVLMLSHPRTMIRDTARFPPYMRSLGKNGGKMKPRSLKELSRQFLKQEIQTGEHDPGEDARMAMFLYRLKMKEWEGTVSDVKKQKVAAFCKLSQAKATHKGAADGAPSTPDVSSSKKRPLSPPLEETNSPSKRLNVGGMFASGGTAIADIDRRMNASVAAPKPTKRSSMRN